MSINEWKSIDELYEQRNKTIINAAFSKCIGTSLIFPTLFTSFNAFRNNRGILFTTLFTSCMGSVVSYKYYKHKGRKLKELIYKKE